MQVKDSVFQYYFYFIQERMNIFWNRYQGKSNLTKDPIFQQYKFTNVYRAQDRVSQYLIRNVIYSNSKDIDGADIILRILIFKIFNRIDTWEYLIKHLGDINTKTFNVDVISSLLTQRIIGKPIFSAAYMMTGSHQKYNVYQSKHEKWLRMVEREIIKEKRIEKIIKSKSLEEVYKILLECSFVGEFIAYQYAIDLNYSDVINFDENSFVKAGIGAIRGIRKCFEGTSLDFEKCIHFTHENFEVLQKKYGFSDFIPLFSRQPTLIDLQNCFCETDKYLRAKIPELRVDNFRIKQKFRPSTEPINFIFPPKWGINNFLNQCTHKNSKALTLF